MLNQPVDLKVCFSQTIRVRLFGGVLLACAFAVFATTLGAAWAGWSVRAWLGLVAGSCGAFMASWWWLARRAVLTMTEEGYVIRLIRGAGTTRARWAEVADLSTTYAADEPCVVLRLADGRRSTIPVRVLDIDREELVRTLQAHLQRGHGLQRL